MISTERPSASSERQPNSRSAPAFHDVMSPSRSVLMMASSLDPTMAANRAAASSDGKVISGLLSTGPVLPLNSSHG
jgi:hypothetical protein